MREQNYFTNLNTSEMSSVDIVRVNSAITKISCTSPSSGILPFLTRSAGRSQLTIAMIALTLAAHYLKYRKLPHA